jgi:hypothetical protein
MKNFYLPVSGWLLTLLLLTTLVFPNNTHAQTIYPGDSIKLSVSNPYRGQLKWQESADGTTWTDMANASTNNSWVKPARSLKYRAKITEDQCEPVYSNVQTITLSTSTGLAVGTTAAAAITAVTATVEGNIIRLGGDAKVTARGVCWNTSPNPTTANTKTSDGTGIGPFTGSLTGLKESTLYYARAYATLANGLTLYGSQVTFTTLQEVVITTTEATAILPHKATAGGTLTYNGAGTITARGVCWTTLGSPTIAASKTNDGTGAGTFTSALTGLSPQTAYFIRAYAITSTGLTVYGPQFTFVTPKSITVTTYTAVANSPTGATGGGAVEVLGSEIITARGVCWNTTPNPTIAHAKISNGNGPGVFTSSITGLTPQTLYYVRAYATSAAGTVYGNEINLFTQSSYLVTTANPTAIGVTTATFGGSVAPNGITTETIIARGVCWNTAQDPTIANNKTTNGTGAGSFTAAITGLAPITTYYVRAYATTNTGKTIYGEGKSLTSASPFSIATTSVGGITATTATAGGSISAAGLIAGTVTARGVCWSTSQNPMVTHDKTSNGTGTGSFSSAITDLLPNTTYYVRAYGISSLGVTVYGSERTFTTADGLAVTTSVISGKTAVSASVGGNVTITAPETFVLVRGVCWSTTANPTIANSKTEDGATAGAFTSSLTNLLSNTKYYVRAYATSGSGKTTYGNEVSFVTEQAFVVTVSTANASGIAVTGATSGGTISTTGFGSITLRGICWSLQQNPTIDERFTTEAGRIYNDGGAGSFTSAVRIRTAGTHYVRAFAVTNYGTTVYGNQITFTTPNPLNVTTANVTGITAVSAMGAGDISVKISGEGVLRRGVCWSTSPNPTVEDEAEGQNGGTGAFSQIITGLTGNTTYYLRAYGSTASEVIVYGNQVSFTTASPPAPTFAVTTTAVTNIKSYSGATGGTITGTGTIASRGICYSTTQNPTIADKKIASGAGTGTFVSQLTYLAPNTRYYIRAYATATNGAFAYGDQVSFTTLPEPDLTVTTSEITDFGATTAVIGGNVSGIGDIEIKGLCIDTSPDPVVSANGSNIFPIGTFQMGPGPESFSVEMIHFSPNTTYYVRAYATSSGKIFYGKTVSFKTSLLTVSTGSVNNVNGLTASVGGQVTLYGGETIKAKGICWATHLNPTIDDFKTSNGAAAGSFTGALTALKVGTYYYARAYATTSSNVTVYGSIKGFTTRDHASIVVQSTGSFEKTTTSVEVGGSIESTGPETVTTRGVCWSATNAIPTLADNKLTNGSGPGAYGVTITGLTAGGRYYYRAYAISNTGAVVYGHAIMFFANLYDPITNPDPGTGGGDTGGGSDTGGGGDTGGDITPTNGKRYLVFGRAFGPADPSRCVRGDTFKDCKAYYYEVVEGEYSYDSYNTASNAVLAKLKSKYSGTNYHYDLEKSNTTARYAVIIQYNRKIPGWDCINIMVTIGYGTSYTEALNDAVARKNEDMGGKTATYSELKRLNW